MIQFFTTIKNGVISNPKVWKQYTSKANGHYIVQLIEKNQRSHNQNSYYWGCVIPLMQDGLTDSGWNELNTPSKVHEFLLEQFTRKELVNHKTGEVKSIRVGSSELTTTEFNTYIEMIQHYASEYLGIIVPNPNTSQDLWSGYAEAATSQKK